MTDNKKINPSTRADIYHIVCSYIGCSGMDPDMCKNRPWDCGILTKLLGIKNKEHEP